MDTRKGHQTLQNCGFSHLWVLGADWSSLRAISAPMHCVDSPATMFITETLKYNLKSDIVKSTAVFTLLKIVFIIWGLWCFRMNFEILF